MRKHLVVAMGLALCASLGAAAGCGSEGGPPAAGEETGVQGDAMIIADPSHYYTVRRDPRRCASPMCGGWFVKEVNSEHPEVYVTGLDFSRAPGFESGDVAVVVDAPERDIVLRGVLGYLSRSTDLRRLVVWEAFRGMPGITRAPDDAFYTVHCHDASCLRADAYRLDAAGAFAFDVLSVDRALAPFVSGAWLADRVERHGAVVAGYFATGEGYDVAGAPERELRASQVYVRVPDAGGPCHVRRALCVEPAVLTYTRDAGLCLHFAGCREPGICPLFIPGCAPGYTLVSWRAGEHACPAYACDPSFAGE